NKKLINTYFLLNLKKEYVRSLLSSSMTAGNFGCSFSNLFVRSVSAVNARNPSVQKKNSKKPHTRTMVGAIIFRLRWLTMITSFIKRDIFLERSLIVDIREQCGTLLYLPCFKRR